MKETVDLQKSKAQRDVRDTLVSKGLCIKSPIPRMVVMWEVVELLRNRAHTSEI